MKFIFLSVSLIAFGCNSNNMQTSDDSGFHKITVLDVLHTSNYTYLQASENDTEKWFALPKIDARKGETYYYDNCMEMLNFESKELNRKFEKIYFLEKISTTPEIHETEQNPSVPQYGNQTGAGAVTEKNNVSVEPLKNGVTIAELFADKDKYEGKKIAVKGKVVKFNAEIMERNWIHIQDGTEHNGKFDLVITSAQKTKVGDVAVFEGTISLNKDFGYGYFFDVLMEDAALK